MRIPRREAIVGLATLGGFAVAARVATWGTHVRGGGQSIAPRSIDIPAGARFADSTLIRTLDERHGAVPMVLVDAAGAEFEVEVMRFDAAAPGVARAGSLAVYINNGGDGRTATHEAHGLAAMALAREIARREANGGAVAPLASLPESQRLRERRGARTA